MKISVGCYLTKGYKNTVDGHIETECCYEEVIDLTEEQEQDYNDGCLSMNCPYCGGELLQDMDHFQPVKEVNNG